MNLIDDGAPFPLDGGRAGDGGESLSARPRHLGGAVERARRLRREQTYPEKVLWADLRKLKANIRRQSPIGRFIVDFVDHDRRLVIEVDGPHHETSEAVAYDAARTAWLEGQGYRVRRFTTRQVVEDREAVLTAIQADRLSPPSQPFPHQGGRALYRARDQWVRDDES
ncbi:endonuclease domain-containing protein [Brevundimonas sp.]|uniref:endonuclease domain-containing protein n=1 Tax=Brevundimonas sp. TaxID=1871086 RepID=UPI004034C876